MMLANALALGAVATRAAGAWVPATWQEGYDVGGAALERWYQRYSGPRVPLVDQVGDVTITNQTEADALAGKRVIGLITIAGSNITLQDFGVKTPDDHDPTSSEYLIDWSSSAYTSLIIQYGEIDGSDKKWSSGIGGIGPTEGVTIQYCEFKHIGVDSWRTHRNGTYEYNYAHDFRAWDEATDGAYNTNTDPHSDCVQVLRSGNAVRRNWLAMTAADNGTSAVMINSDTTETLVNCTIEENYIDGGGYPCHVHPGNNDINNPGPYGYPRGIEFINNLFGRTSRETSTPFSTDGMPNANGDLITWSGNVYDDTREAVPLPTVIPRPAELIYDGAFDEPLVDAENWVNLSTAGGTLDFSGNDLEIARAGGQTGRGFFMINTVPGESYDLVLDFAKTAINMQSIVGIARTGTGSNISTATRTGSGTFTQTFTATQYDHYVYVITGSGSDGNVINVDNISCHLTP